jgi:SOS response regulatory protein OraA/RecX
VRSRGREELARALAERGFERPAIDDALRDLEEKGLLDDLAAARSAVRVRGAKYGRIRIERELFARGFSRDVIAEALSAREPDTEEKALASALAKAWRSNAGVPPPARRRRVIDALARRGFSARRVSEMIDGLNDEIQRGPRALS